MKQQFSKFFTTPVATLVTVFAVVLVLDSIFGDSNFNPTEWLSSVWLAESVAVIVAGSVAAATIRPLRRALPWMLAAISVLALCAYIGIANYSSVSPPPDRYNTFIGKVYYIEHNTLPYNTPFRSVDKDYLLESDVPEFFALQPFVLVPLLVGYAVQRGSRN